MVDTDLINSEATRVVEKVVPVKPDFRHTSREPVKDVKEGFFSVQALGDSSDEDGGCLGCLVVACAHKKGMTTLSILPHFPP